MEAGSKAPGGTIVKSFVQYNPTPVFFGRGRHHQVGDLVKEHSDSVLLVVEGGIPPLEKEIGRAHV